MFGREGSHTMQEINKEAEKWLDFVNLRDKKDIPIQSINIVERKRTDLAKALAASPKLLFIDELMAGLNTKDIEGLMDLIKKINQLGITILFIEHVMKAVMGISHRVMVLHHGEKIVEGLPEKVMKNEKVLQAYLGKRRTKRKEKT
jgi:branched-chain amino acid transport system ATP-binding protein